jgi:hypothetical protein
MHKLTLILLFASGTALADESRIQLKDGEGKNLVQTQCAICHSLDYIQMNSPFLNRAGWDATVSKMIKVMGAPVRNDQDKAAIVDYLTAHYGKRP